MPVAGSLGRASDGNRPDSQGETMNRVLEILKCVVLFVIALRWHSCGLC